MQRGYATCQERCRPSSIEQRVGKYVKYKECIRKEFCVQEHKIDSSGGLEVVDMSYLRDNKRGNVR